MEKITVYKQLVDHLVRYSGIKNQKDFVKYASKTLGLGEVSIYNKISDRSRFSVEELYKLCQELNISLDAVLHGNNPGKSYIQFYGDGLKYKPRNYKDFVDVINNYFSKIKTFDNACGYFLVNEIPLFHLLNFPHIMYLKFYIWNKINWKIENIGEEYNFRSFIEDFELQQSIKVLDNMFNSFMSIELWNSDMLKNSISLLHYLIDSKILTDPTEIKNIQNDFYALIDYLEQLTKIGKKKKNLRNEENPCHIFINELSLGSEVIVVKSQYSDMLFQQMDIPNYIQTTDQRLISSQFNFFETLRSMSIDITQTNQKLRDSFFVNLRNQINSIC